MSIKVFDTASARQTWEVSPGANIHVCGLGPTWGSSRGYFQVYDGTDWYNHPAELTDGRTANFSYVYPNVENRKVAFNWTYGSTAGEKVAVDVAEVRVQTR